MYPYVLLVHSWLRWIVLSLGLVVLAGALRAVIAREPWSAAQQRLQRAFMGTLDAQFTLGALLYLFLSPISAAAFSDFRAAMNDPPLRFFGVEHAATMFIAVSVAHIGAVRARRKEGPARPRTVLIFQALWLVLTLAAIPWPGLDIGRPLFRM